MEVALYNVRLRFQRLFADPLIFDDPSKLVQRYLVHAGLPFEKTIYLRQANKEIIPVDDAGNPSAITGTARYRHQGKVVRSEYMSPANLEISYVDFGSGLGPDEHQSLWSKGHWENIDFKLSELKHEDLSIELPSIEELHKMLRERADPSTLVTVELSVPETLFELTVSYAEDRLRQLGENQGETVEVYAAKDLEPQERQALEKRLARQSSPSTLFIIFSTSPKII